MNARQSPAQNNSVPSKSERQARFLAQVAEKRLSPEAAAGLASFIPKEMVARCKVLHWPL